MFLIDSSAWVEYFRPKGSITVKERIRSILQKEEAVSCGIVVVEVLRGSRYEKDFQTLNESLRSLPQIPIDDDVIGRASRWGFMLDRKGKIVSTTDLLIASAAYKKARLIHLDRDFELISSVVDLDEERIQVFPAKKSL